MNARTYIYKNVEYSYQPTFKKWVFKTPNYTLAQVCRGGGEIASRVAKIVSGGLARTKSNDIDNLARFHIKQLTGI